MVAEKDEVHHNCVTVKGMIDNGYVESDATNPLTGENISSSNDVSNQKVCKADVTAQDDYELQDGSYYSFDGYKYYVE